MRRSINKLFLSLAVVFSFLCGVNLSKADSYYDRKVEFFELLPIGENDIVFLGNSITDGGDFKKLLGIDNVKNRGISSDVIGGVEKRLEQVLRGHPKKLFLLIGINDVSHNLTVQQLADKYELLVKKICEMSPGTEVYLQSVMPVNNDFKRYKSLIGKEKTIKAFNKEIERIAEENGCAYIDLTEALADPVSGKLRKEFTRDGLHLSNAGYEAWMSVVRPYLDL